MADRFGVSASKSPNNRPESIDSLHKGEKRTIDQLQDSDQGKGDDNVHSANAWEQANLGDDERKQKFLRLMGAGKKQHHGRFVIGDTKTVHTKAVESEEKAKRIEEQYLEGMEHKLVSSRHAGFGFHTDAGPSFQKANNFSKPDNEEKKPETVDKKETNVETKKVSSEPISPTEEETKKSENTEKDEQKVGFKKLSFVKGSS